MPGPTPPPPLPHTLLCLPPLPVLPHPTPLPLLPWPSVLVQTLLVFLLWNPYQTHPAHCSATFTPYLPHGIARYGQDAHCPAAATPPTATPLLQHSHPTLPAWQPPSPAPRVEPVLHSCLCLMPPHIVPYPTTFIHARHSIGLLGTGPCVPYIETHCPVGILSHCRQPAPPSPPPPPPLDTPSRWQAHSPTYLHALLWMSCPANGVSFTCSWLLVVVPVPILGLTFPTGSLVPAPLHTPHMVIPQPHLLQQHDMPTLLPSSPPYHLPTFTYALFFNPPPPPPPPAYHYLHTHHLILLPPLCHAYTLLPITWWWLRLGRPYLLYCLHLPCSLLRTRRPHYRRPHIATPLAVRAFTAHTSFTCPDSGC